MKKYLSLIVCSFLVSFSALAESPFDSDIDVSEEFAELQAIESFLEANPNVDFATLETEKSDLLADISLSNSTASLVSTDDMPIVSAFWWGCVLGIIGLVLVYVMTDNDKDQVKKALIGCVVSTLLVGITGILGGFWF